MELAYKIGNKERRATGEAQVVKALTSLNNNIETAYEDGTVPDDNFVFLKVSGLSFRLGAQGIAAQLCIPHQSAQERLENDRKAAADAYFDNFDFGDNIVADHNGWERVQGQDRWKKVVFFENPACLNSIRGEFHLVFKPGSFEIEDGDYSL